MSYWEDEKPITCFLYCQQDVPEEIDEFIASGKYPQRMIGLKIGRDIEEINSLIEEYKGDGLKSHDRYWAVIGTVAECPCRRWEGHYFQIPSWKVAELQNVSYSLKSLSEIGCWWYRAHIDPDRKEIYGGIEKAIFLDVDGVLNHTDGKNYIEKDLQAWKAGFCAAGVGGCGDGSGKDIPCFVCYGDACQEIYRASDQNCRSYY